MAFIKNDKVFVKSLRRSGEVSKVLKGDRYRVMVGNAEVTCSQSDLEKEDGSKKAKHPSKKYKLILNDHPALRPVKNKRDHERVDLHGMRVLDAMDYIQKRIDQAIIEDMDRLEIIHGVGTGRIMTALHKYLSTLSVISAFKMDDVNPGVTWVYF